MLSGTHCGRHWIARKMLRKSTGIMANYETRNAEETQEEDENGGCRDMGLWG